MENLRIGVALCGSFCTFSRLLEQIRGLTERGHTVIPILSFHAAQTDTRFGTADSWKKQLREITGREPLCTLPDVEPIGPKGLLDVLAVAPCTGTTLGLLANGISNTPVTLAAKSHLRCGRPVVLAVSTNDALGASMRNIAQLKNAKNIFFVPMAQDDPTEKPNSLVADFSQLEPAIQAALEGRQLPLFR